MNLPTELLEIIFSHIPLTNLLKSHALVCKKWHAVISRKKFLFWKKCYYKYKRQCDKKAEDYLMEIARDNGISNTENCLWGLVKYISHWKANIDWPVDTALKKHPRYSAAEEIFNKRFLHSIPLNLWSIVSILCIISHDVHEIYFLLQILINSRANCTAVDVIEAFYCIATLLLYSQRSFGIPSRLHYNIYYTLYVYENACGAKSVIQLPHISTGCGELNLEKPCNKEIRKTLNDEQFQIVDHNFQPHEIIKVIAFAGTGKTTTLVELTKTKPHLQFLLVVFNRAVKNQSQLLFPNNVKCVTAHGLAYRALGDRYKGRQLRNLTVHDIVRSYALRRRDDSGSLYRRAAIVLLALNNYMSSRDDVITMAHVPTTYHVSSSHIGNEVIFLDDDMRLGYASDAEIVWNRISSVEERKFPMPFDGLLKLWQLEKPDLVQDYNVNCIMVDEGQDMNAAMLDVLLNQSCTRIIVGDPHQQIYQFRGAINALQSVSSDHTFYLTQSFRFGPAIGFVANSCLEVFGKITNQTLVGNRTRDELGLDGGPMGKGKCCIIGRTNLGLYKKVVDIVCNELRLINLPNQLKIAFAGGFDGYEYRKLRDLWYLMKGEKSKIEDKFIKRWDSYQDLKDFAEKALDQEMLCKLGMVEWSLDKTEKYVNAVQSRTISSMKDADVIFATAHKSKGLEWDVVALLDDFATFHRRLPVTCSVQEAAEYNLLYVAVTRAKTRLILNNAAYYTLAAVNEKGERILHSECYWGNDLPVQCVDCGAVMERATISLKCYSLTLFSGHSFKEGLLCTVCTARTHYRVPVLDWASPFRDIREDKTRIAFSPFLRSTERLTETSAAQLVF